MIIEKRLMELGITLPPVPKPMGSYATWVQAGDMVYLSGTGSADIHKFECVGKVGCELTLEQGYEAARGAVLNLFSTLKSAIGDLDKVEQIVKVLGFVNSAPDFHRQPEVMNGASDLLVAIFGEKGRHARSAIGTDNLPFNIPVEVEMIVKVKNIKISD